MHSLSITAYFSLYLRNIRKQQTDLQQITFKNEPPTQGLSLPFRVLEYTCIISTVRRKNHFKTKGKITTLTFIMGLEGSLKDNKRYDTFSELESGKSKGFIFLIHIKSKVTNYIIEVFLEAIQKATGF